jgi:hypothetical protein
MSCSSDWVQLAASFGAPIIAFIAAGIAAFFANRQARTAKNKLKLDLFEKRFNVYEKARELIAQVVTQGRLNQEQILVFAAGVRESRWLLNAEVSNYLKKTMWDKAHALIEVTEELAHERIGDRRQVLAAKKSDLFGWFGDQYEVLDEKFAQFLQIDTN